MHSHSPEIHQKQLNDYFGYSRQILTVKKFLDVLDENVKILADLEFDLDDEKEDDLMPNMELHDLYDMTEDVAQSVKIKRAELNLARRQAEDSL